MKSTRVGSLELLQFTSIPIQHAISTRSGGISSGACSSLNVGQHRHDTPENIAENRRRICEAAGMPVEILAMKQVHSANVAAVSTWLARPVDGLPEVDALITHETDITLMAKGADCPVVLLFDPKTPAIATIHSGWRGTAADIVGNTVCRMVEEFGTNPADILSGIGPCIGPDRYEVGPEVIEQMEAALPQLSQDDFSKPTTNSHALLNLPVIIEHQLQTAGVGHIEQAGLCTYSDPDRFFSHRRDGAATGRIGLFASLT